MAQNLGDELEGPTTPAGPVKKTPVPLMSLAVEPPPNVEELSSAPEQPASDGLKLPKALEEALAFKTERAIAVGVNPADIEKVESEGRPQEAQGQRQAYGGQRKQVSLVEDGEDEKKEKGKRNKKKKKKKKNRPEEWARQAALEAERKNREEEEKEKENGDVEVEYIQEKLDLDFSDPKYRQFAKVFEAFQIGGGNDEKEKEQREKELQQRIREEFKKVPKLLEEDDMIEEKDDDDTPKLSKRKLKKLNRLSVAELKQLVSRPDVVEMHDVTAYDPRLLVHLKSTRNTVPVPRHWCFKRKYLQGKRGIEKPPVRLTGVY